jgi:hypothetical protein
VQKSTDFFELLKNIPKFLWTNFFPRCLDRQLRKIYGALRRASHRDHREPSLPRPRDQQTIFTSDGQKYEIHKRRKFSGIGGDDEAHDDDPVVDFKWDHGDDSRVGQDGIRDLKSEHGKFFDEIVLAL